MSSVYGAVVREFESELLAIERLVEALNVPAEDRNVRVASANAAMLLLAATYEEFIRQMAQEYARAVVGAAADARDVPVSIVETAWKRTLERAGLIKSGPSNDVHGFENNARQIRQQLEAVFKFIDGDRTQDIFVNLIHNPNQMRPRQMNSLFKVSGLNDACRKICDCDDLKNYFDGENDAEVIHGHLLKRLEDFFNTRNEIAHSLNPGMSVSADVIKREITLFSAIGRGLQTILENC